jgi:PBP1b-binding outer membrane lipoprotein LpoB
MNRITLTHVVLGQALLVGCSQGPTANGDASQDRDNASDARDDFRDDLVSIDAVGLDAALMDSAMEDVAITALSVDPPATTLLVTDRAVRQRARLIANARLPDGRTIAVPAV